MNLTCGRVHIIFVGCKLMNMTKSVLSGHYIAPDVVCIHYTFEGLLCTSPKDPGYGGNEDMELGDEL